MVHSNYTVCGFLTNCWSGPPPASTARPRSHPQGPRSLPRETHLNIYVVVFHALAFVHHRNVFRRLVVKVEVWLFSGEVWVWPIWHSNNSNTTASAACFCTAADCHKIVPNLIFTAHKWPQFTRSISTSNTTAAESSPAQPRRIWRVERGLVMVNFTAQNVFLFVNPVTLTCALSWFLSVWVCYGLNSCTDTLKLADKLADTLVKTKFDPSNRRLCWAE